MDFKKLIAKLHPLERKVLPVLIKEQELSAISKKTKLKEIEVMRSLQWLENKDLLKIKTEKKKIISLGSEGERYKREGLPEKAFLGVLAEEFKGLNVVTKKSKLSRQEVNACLGLLKKKGAIEIKKEENQLLARITAIGKKLRHEQMIEEQLIDRSFPLLLEEIEDVREKLALEELKNRKGVLKIEEKKLFRMELTKLGKEVAGLDLEGEVINRLTTGMLKTGSWKEKIFRAYDIEINVPKIYPGKNHFVTEAVEYIKKIWLEMGFQEMCGNYVQSAFWDLDALFVPQDHPAREMQDTFYLEGKAKLPAIWEKIKAVHETGGDTGSRGWRYNFSQEETERVLLRTHTTVLSAQTITNLKKEDLPAKFFAVGKVFRNESMDWKHLFEFYQVEGIVVDPDANLKHLKGYLREFYEKMGYHKVRMRPAHFPYTEPSLEVDVFHPIKKEWLELGGAGIFRPEVVKPLLGIDCPVLAWGQGMSRIISEYLGITDLRDLDKNDLKQIREMKAWLK